VKKWLFILIVLLFGIYFFHPVILQGMGRFLIVRDVLEPTDLIVVLGGDINGERVNEAVALYKQGYAKKMLMSGGELAWKLTSADQMKKQAAAMGVDPRAILLEDKSRSTIENAEFSLPIIKKNKVNSFILVTSLNHSRRANRAFKKVYSKEGIKVISWPARKSRFLLPKWWTRHEDTQLVMWEYGSLVYYLFKGY
jgi:uncharacterized SAM-binding protein YcdF (DUF218 family)